MTPGHRTSVPAVARPTVDGVYQIWRAYRVARARIDAAEQLLRFSELARYQHEAAALARALDSDTRLLGQWQRLELWRRIAEEG